MAGKAKVQKVPGFKRFRVRESEDNEGWSEELYDGWWKERDDEDWGRDKKAQPRRTLNRTKSFRDPDIHLTGGKGDLFDILKGRRGGNKTSTKKKINKIIF